MEEKDLAECGGDCFVIEYDTRSPVAETEKHSDTKRYAMPKQGDGYYDFGFYPAMRKAFEEEARRQMDRYKAYGKGCPDGCECQKNAKAKPVASSWWEVPVEASYTFPDGSLTISILGHFEVMQLKSAGTCRPSVAEPDRGSKGSRSAMGFDEQAQRREELPQSTQRPAPS